MNPRRRALLAAAGLAAWAAPGLSLGNAPADTGWLDLDWRDRTRQREVPVRLYPPANALGEVPLVLFSHGFGGERSHATWLGRTLAAQGIACAHVQHVGSDYRVWLSGPLQWALREFRGDMARERLERVRDMKFALDTLLSGPHGARIDRQRIAVVGHSLGAQTALLMGGAQMQRADGPLREPRVAAALAFGTAAFAGFDTPEVLRAVQVPTLHVTTEEDKTSMPGYAASVDDRVAWFRATGGPGGPAKALVVFSQGRHALFNDAGPEDPVGAAAAGPVAASGA